MSKLDTIYASNPLTSLPLDALLYVLDNPASTDDDAGINANDLLAQIIGTRIDGAKLSWNSATSITIGTGLLVAQNRDVINITSAITKSSLSLSASTWYHVYVYLSSGTPAGEVVTTAPTAWKGTAYSKTGDTSRRYVGSVLTDGSGNVRNFVHNPANNVVSYRKFNSTASPFRVLSAGAATTATAVDCSGIVPVTTTSVIARMTNLGSANFSSSEDNGVGASQITISLAGTLNQTISHNHLLDSSRQLWYVFDSAPSGGAYIDIVGYWFDR